jgi:putative membrane protein
MKSRTWLICLGLCALPLAALANDTPRQGESARPQSSKNSSVPDTAYVLTKLHDTNLMEIEAAKLAKDNAASDGVKDYADKLQSDHEKADDDVKSLAKEERVQLATKLSADSDGAAMLQRLRNVRGADFDRQFLDMMVTDHDKAISMVKAWQAEAQDKKVRSLLEDLLPTLEKHRDQARKLSRKT